MALSSSALKSEILAVLQAQGIKTSGPHAKAEVMVEAIAQAVVKHIQSNAQVLVPSGSSAGSYRVL